MRRQEIIETRLRVRMKEARAILKQREDTKSPLYGTTQYYQLLKEIDVLFWVLGLPVVYGWELSDYEKEVKNI